MKQTTSLVGRHIISSVGEHIDTKMIKAILTDRPVAYHPAIARAVGGVAPGLFLSQLLYWSDKGRDTEGWIYKTQKEWEEETALTRREQETARKKLVACGALEEQRKGVPARLYYRINWNGFMRALRDSGGLAEADTQGWRDAPNKNGATRQSKSETTTDITSETTNTGVLRTEVSEPVSDTVQFERISLEEIEKGYLDAYRYLKETGPMVKGVKGLRRWCLENDITPDEAEGAAIGLGAIGIGDGPGELHTAWGGFQVFAKQERDVRRLRT